MVVSSSGYFEEQVAPGRLIAERYRVCETIGTGGMGVVLRVQDSELGDEELALKILKPHLLEDEIAFKRFLNEVRVARSLTHDNIVRIYDIGRSVEGMSYISMELVSGKSLKQVIGQHVSIETGTYSLAPRRAAEILLQVMRGVSFAHKKGVVHRDLKPANVLIQENGEVKIVDFGTARVQGAETNLTMTGVSVGTPDYMCPEQIKGEEAGESGDIYSLGIMAFELFTGRRPFEANSQIAVSYKHVHEPLPVPSSVRSDLPNGVDEFLLKATHKDPDQRYSSVQEMFGSLAETIGIYTETDQENSLQIDDTPTEMDLKFNFGTDSSDNEFDWSFRSEPMVENGLELDRDLSPEHLELESKTPGKGSFRFLASALALATLLLILSGRGSESLNSEQGAFAGDLEKRTQLDSQLLERGTDLARASSPANNVVQGDKETVEANDDRDSSAAKETTVVVAGEAVKRNLSIKNSKQLPSEGGLGKEVEQDKALETKTEIEQFSAKEAEKEKVVQLSDIRFEFWRYGVRVKGGLSSAKLDDTKMVIEAKLGGAISKSELNKGLKANLFSLKEKELASSIPVFVSSKTGSDLKVAGRLGKVAKNITSGDYRMDLLFQGEVVGSKRINIYSASLSRKPGAGSESPGSRIRILNKPTYVPKGDTLEGQMGSVAGDPGRRSQSGSELKPVDSVPDSVKQKSFVETPRLPSSALPPAQKEGAIQSAVKLRLNRELPSILRATRYSGEMVFSEGPRSVKLDIVQGAGGLSGQAEIERLGSFQLSGRFLKRGVEIVLSGQSGRFRLSGSKRGELLKGQFHYSGKQTRGSWSARLRH